MTDHATGAATVQGTIGDGDTRLIGLATTAVPEPAFVSALLGVGVAVVLSRRQVA